MNPGWLVVVPAIGVAVVLALGHRDPGGRTPAWTGAGVGVVTWLLGLGVAIPALASSGAERWALVEIPTGTVPFRLALTVDGLTAAMVLLTSTVALLVLLYSVSYLAGETRRTSYTALVLVFTAAMLLVVLADDFFVLLVGWEVMGACSYFLIGHYWERPAARAGAIKAFVVTQLGDVGFLFGIFAFGTAAGTFSLSGINAAAANGELSTVETTTALLLVLCGVVGKSAQFPLHTWLPDAMPGPSPISALIHAATMVAAGVYLVARLDDAMATSPVARSVLAVIAAITMLLGALFALAQDDLKRVLAWSTVSQLAYMFGALAIGGYAAGVFHLLSHGAFKALLFLGAGSVSHAVGSTSMGEMGGLRRRLPLAFVSMTVGFAALAGLVPVVGFFSKDAVLGAAYEGAVHGGLWQGWLVLLAGFVTALVTAAYSARAWLLVFFGRDRTKAPAEAAPATVHGEPDWPMQVPLVVLTVLTLVGGLLVLDPAVLDPLGRSAEIGLVHPTLAVVVLLAVVVVLLVAYGEWWRVDGFDPVARFGRVRRLLHAELYVDRTYDRGVVRPTRFLAQTVVAGDRDVVDPYVRGSAGAARWLGIGLRRLQYGNVQVYLTAVVVGALVIGAAAWWVAG